MAGFKNGALALKKKDLGTTADPNFINILVDTDNKLYSIDEFGVYRFYVSESSLSAYLPLSGGTLTGGLSGTNAAFNGTLSYAGGTFRQYTGSPAWTSFYGSYTTTPNDNNYHLRFLGDGSSSFLNGTLESALRINDLSIARATSTGLEISGVATANSFVKSGGTSTQFLKADGSVDSNTYITSSSLSPYTLITITSAISANLQAQITLNNSKLSAYLPLSGGTLSGLLRGTTISASGNITATSFVKSGGTSTQFLKADGSIDSNIYITTAFAGSYLPLSGGTMSGRIYSTKSGFSLTNAAISLESLEPTIAFRQTNSVVNSRCWNIGTEYNSLTISSYDDTYSAAIRALQCYRAPSSGRISLFLGDMTTTDVFVPISVGGILKAEETTGKLVIASAGDFPIFAGSYLPLSGGTLTGLLRGTTVSASGSITATSFVKSGGTSTQFLKADGSVDPNTYALASSLGNYLPLAGGTLNVGAQIITRKDATTSPVFTNIKYSEAPIVIQRASTSNSDMTNVAGIGFHNQGINAALFYYDPSTSNFFYNRHDGAFARIWDSSNLTNLNQLTNGPGYVSGGPYIPIAGGVTATSAVIFGNAKIGRALVNGSSSRFGHEDHDAGLGYDGFYQESTGELFLATQGPQINFRLANTTRAIISNSLMTITLPLSLAGNLSGTNAILTGKVTAQTARLGVQRVNSAGGYYLTSTGANSEYWVFVTYDAEFSNIYLPTDPQDGCAFCFVQQACRQVNIVSPTTGVLIHYYYSAATQSVSIPTTPATYLGANNTGPWVWVVYDSANGGGWWMTGSWSGTYA